MKAAKPKIGVLREEAEGRSQKKCLYKYEMLPSQLMILYHSPLAETRWLKSQPSLQKVVKNI
ncbi:hypothetical protein QUB22_09475 [Microcoleus sp. AT9_A5]